MDQIERSAATVEEAVESALRDLGITEQEALVEVVQEPRGGFLGFNAQQATVRVSRAPAAAEEGSDELIDEQADVAADFLEGLLEAMGMPGEVEIHSEEGLTYVEIWAPEEGGADEDEMGVLIGKHGNTLDSLQELVRINVQRVTGERCLVIVDIEDYRKRRRAQLIRRARELAGRVRTSGRPERLEPMSSFERKIVHDAVGTMGGLVTGSEGEEPSRYVVIRRQEGSPDA
jgi:spoIIIJ-associated protein